MGSVQRWPGADGGDDLPPIELYKAAIDEYRFQARFNWSRTQYLLAFNVAILTAGIAVTNQFGSEGAIVFVLGTAAAVLSGLATHTQHDYDRAARDRIRHVEEVYGVPHDRRVDTTATLGKRRRLVSVNQVVFLLLGIMATANLFGCILAITGKTTRLHRRHRLILRRHRRRSLSPVAPPGPSRDRGRSSPARRGLNQAGWASISTLRTSDAGQRMRGASGLSSSPGRHVSTTGKSQRSSESRSAAWTHGDPARRSHCGRHQ